MLPEIGIFSIVISFFFNILILCLLFYFYFFDLNLEFINKSLVFSFAQVAFIFFAILILIISFLLDDFSVLYVYSNSNSKLPLIYKLSALWGAHEGSFLLLVFLFSFLVLVFSLFKINVCVKFIILNRIILYILLLFFISLLLFTSNPFIRIDGNLPIDGMDLNPLLQDIGLIIHPPLLYIGYVCFAFPFSFALSILVLAKYKIHYFRYIYLYTLFALIFLTAGILLGSWWAYYELGWGGYWFWDPVENASFMPWLSGIVLIHLIVLLRSRNLFHKSVLLVSIVTFLLCLLSIFLVRSGIINSVHAFASSNNRKFYFFLFFFTVSFFSLSVYFSRFRLFYTKVFNFTFFSKEFFLTSSIFFIIIALLTVFLGTFYPFFIDNLFDINISVGSNYFNSTVVPIILLAIIFMPFSIFLNWKNSINSFNVIIKLFSISFVFFIILLYFYNFSFSYFFSFSLFVIIFVIFSLFFYIFNKFFNFNRFLIFLSHFSVILVVIGITFSSFFSIEKDVVLKIGNNIKISDYNFVLNRILKKDGENYISYIGEFFVEKNNEIICKMYPEKRMFYVSGLTMTEASIKSHYFIDFYLALGNNIDSDNWGVRIYYKPLVLLIWIGGALIFISFFLRFFLLFFKYIKY